MKSIIIIPSRMASKRFPGKPLVKIDGIPMVQRVWQQAINSKVGDVYVACSENEVFDLINNLGGKAILTDPNLPSGTDRIHSAFQQIDNTSEIEYIINLQGDMPLINPNHIKKVIEPLKNNYSLGTLATTLNKNEQMNPNITKVLVDWKNNYVGEAKEFFRIKNKINNRTFHHVGIYSYSVDSLKKFVSLPKSKNEVSLNLEQYRAMDAGMSIGITYQSEIPPSIDTKEDLIVIENIIRANHEKN
tara:strand:+ start:13 stop:747 length:735 start_codon:yes stop_codon:yes gene_type:complete